MSTATKPSTARKGDPENASRGAAVERAKAALSDALDRRLIPLEIQMENELLATVIGCTPAEVSQRLSVATLGELEDWTQKIEAGPSNATSAA